MSLDALDRLGHIKGRIDADGRVRIADLARQLEVSEMTIRRDLDVLVEEGAARRVRGGAIGVGPQQFADRFGQQARAKMRIAEKLADLVGDGGVIGIDASSTMQRLASRLTEVRDLTVVTNGLDTFEELQNRTGVAALLTGGRLDPRTGSLVGPLATRVAGDLLLRRYFASASAIDVDGTSEATLEEAEVKLAMVRSAAEVVIGVDHTKIGQRSAARCVLAERIDYLVTDLDPRDTRLDPFRDTCRIV